MRSIWRELVRYGFAGGEVVLFLLVDFLAVSVSPAKILTAGLIFILNFLTHKVVLFWGGHHDAKN